LTTPTMVENQDNSLIVGDMAELGAAAEVEHRNLGEQAAKRGVKKLYACGDYAQLVATAFGEGAMAFDNQADLLAHLSQDDLSGTILVKGSRSARMERVVEVLHKQLAECAPVSSRGEH